MKNEYDTLCQKIYELRASFYSNHGIKPNSVNIGHDEFYTLRNGNRFLIENGNKNIDEDNTVFGMKLNRVIKDNYLSVGLMIED
jgi:hypothetical protein